MLSFTAIMTYRFLLNLHEVARSTAGNITIQGDSSEAPPAGRHATLMFRVSGDWAGVVSRTVGERGTSVANGDREADEWVEDVARSSQGYHPASEC